MPSRTRTIPFLIFLLAQTLAGIAVAAVWVLLRRPLTQDPGNWPVGIGIVCVAVLSLAIFLILGKKGHFLRLLDLDRFSFQGAALFLASFLVAGLTGLLVRSVIPYLLKGTLSPLVATLLFCLCVGLPFLVFDLLLTGDRSVRLIESIQNLRRHRVGRLLEKLALLWDGHPLAASLLVGIIVYAAFFLVFHVGYETNDDVAMIAIVSGYLSGSMTPMLVFSNVLLGFLLNFLYSLPTRLNWEILLFLALNFLSVWACLYQVFARLQKRGWKMLGSLVIFLCDAYFLIKVNFTSIAALAALAGCCGLFVSFMGGSPLRKGSLTVGVTLILAASLIRMESMLLVLLAILPAALVYWRNFSFRRLAITGGVAALLVGGCYVFNRVYVNSFPEWRAYNQYNQVRSSLRDTPRLANLAGTYPEVGWSENDYQSFVHWFFPDPQVYSLQALQTLVADTPPERAALAGTLALFSGNLARLISLPYLFLVAAVWLTMLVYQRPLKKSLLPSLLVAVTCLGLIVYLITVMKLPNRVLLSIFSTGVIFGFFLLLAPGPERTDSLPPDEKPGRASWLAVNSLLLSLALASGLVLGQAAISSRTNLKRQTAYHRVLADLDALRQRGALLPDALIISPAYGVPLEWANPLVLDFPQVQYLSLGWLTFSPPYEKVLEQYGVASLPAGFYQNDNVYLMVSPARLDGIRQFILEHAGVEVEASMLYEMPPVPGEPAYDGVKLYKLELKR